MPRINGVGMAISYCSTAKDSYIKDVEQWWTIFPFQKGELFLDFDMKILESIRSLTVLETLKCQYKYLIDVGNG